MAHYPFLIITSEKILNQTLQFFENDKNITFLENEFNDYNNTDYFQVSFKDNLTIEGTKLLKTYENCTINKGTKNCELEWDNFIQYYWPNMYTEKYSNLPGFEMYQITVDSDFVFQPSFITSSGKFMSGTHFIIGGSFEDNWGVAFLIEAISRKYVPMLFELLIPFYKAIRSRFKNVFIAVEYKHQRFGYSEPIIDPGIKLLTELYSQFNFSHEALFTVGHSVGGTLMKGVSYYTDIRGISFEASDAENTVKDSFSPKFNVSTSGLNKMVNIYSQKNIFSGLDDDFYINGRFINGFYAPNVYETACLTAITCSETMKYVPFCKQAFLGKEENSDIEFDNNLKKYLEQYGY